MKLEHVTLRKTTISQLHFVNNIEGTSINQLDLSVELDNNLEANNEDDSFVQICNGIEVVGPSKEYVLEVAGQALDSRQGDSIDNETTVNAASVQISINLGTSKLLLVGDASTKAIEKNAKEHQIIQIPHHGRLDHAEDLFEIKKDDKDTVYLISDNKGSSSGGSEELISKGKDKGHTIFNTRTEDTKTINSATYRKSYRVGSYI